MNYLEYFPTALHDQVQKVHAEKQQWINQPKKGFLRYRKPIDSVKHLRASSCDFSGDTVTIGRQEDISRDDLARVRSVMHTFMPWRKGPFNVFGIEIDAEWRSERKWNRLMEVMPELRDKVIADIGCNNGYYMFRSAFHAPRFVLGFEPYIQHYYTFNTLNTFAALPHLAVDLLGVEHINLFPSCFDVIFFLGIVYHRPSPIDTLRDIFTALKPGGTLLVESQAIPGNDPVALFPEQTYAKVPGSWFIPTGTCLINWLKRTGFRHVQLFCSHPMSSTEQRKTDWMIFESYEDFIDKDDSALTIEKYPAPWRVYIRAEK